MHMQPGDYICYRLHQPENETDRRIAALEREIEGLKQARRDEQAPPQPVPQ